MVFNQAGNFKSKTLKDAIEFLELSGIGDLGGLLRDMRKEGAWYNDGEGCGIEKQDGRNLRDVPFTPF